jgi:hypothetical protein
MDGSSLLVLIPQFIRGQRWQDCSNRGCGVPDWCGHRPDNRLQRLQGIVPGQKPLVRIPGSRSLNPGSHIYRKSVRKGWKRFGGLTMHRRQHIVRPERAYTGQQVVVDQAQRVDIAATVCSLSASLLRRHELWRTDHHGIPIAEFWPQDTSYSEIGDGGVVQRPHKDVLRLQIPVDNPLAMSVRQGIAQLKDEPAGALNRHWDGQGSQGIPVK